MTTQATLALAADLIDARGWYSFGRSQGPRSLCVIDAIRLALKDQGVNEDQREAATQEICEAVVSTLALPASPTGTDAVVRLAEWNDEPERTQAEVTAAMRQAA